MDEVLSLSVSVCDIRLKGYTVVTELIELRDTLSQRGNGDVCMHA